MGGTAILDPDVLIDSLVVDVIDGLRGELHPEFGVRAYRVFTVKRTWQGAGVGIGKATDVETELLPQPRVESWDGRKFELAACGLNDNGEIRLTEVSLSYTYPELMGGKLNANQQWFIKLSEAHGQLQPDNYFIPSKAPFVDREKTLGWIFWLRKVDT